MDENQVRNIAKDVMMDSQYSVAGIPFHEHTGTDGPKIPFTSLESVPRAFCVAATTKGTSAVNVFGSGGANFNLTITGAFLISNDTTGGNITIKNASATVATIAKGTSATAMVGATILTNTAYTSGRAFTITSSSAGNATVFITYTA